MHKNEENLVTWLLMCICFFAIILWASLGQKFDAECEKSCAPLRAISPIYNLQQTCFCEEGHGRWKLKEVVNQ